jgi:tetratricopeptide (TPR) repeat protein
VTVSPPLFLALVPNPLVDQALVDPPTGAGRAIDANHPRAHNNLALVYAHMERTEEALAEFQRAGSSATDADVNLAFSLALDKRWQSAPQEYRRAMAANPSSDILKARLREIDRLIAVNEVRTPKLDATRDDGTIPVSISPSRPAPQGKLMGTTDKATRPKIPPPFTLEPSSR